ncbi:MAG: hypothetical protein IKG22_05920, partial [Atopobiaceae bacterium]|nr:hypothetical protein [Atopobiaceae bacterium]
MPRAARDVAEDGIEKGPRNLASLVKRDVDPCLRANLANPERQNSGASKRPGTAIPLLSHSATTAILRSLQASSWVRAMSTMSTR